MHGIFKLRHDCSEFGLNENNCYPVNDIDWDKIDKTYDGGFLVFIHEFEGHMMWHIIDQLHKDLEKHNIESNKVIFINCDYNIEKNYKMWLNYEFKNSREDILVNVPSKKWNPLNTIFYDSLHDQVSWHIKDNLYTDGTTYEEYFLRENYLPQGKNTRLFVYLNRQLKPHRIFALNKVEQKGLLDNSYWSCLEANSSNIRNTSVFYGSDIRLPKVKELDGSTYEDDPYLPFNLTPKMYPDELKTERGFEGRNLSWFHHKTYFSLVSESNISEHHIFLTEKVLKPIFYGQPFIVIANPYMLKYLKSIGYETYPEIFDESYDEILDSKERILKIVEEVYRLSKLSKKELDSLFGSVIEKAKYNQELFIDNEGPTYNLRKNLGEII